MLAPLAFLNVDLCVTVEPPHDALVAALSPAAFPLHPGDRGWLTFELAEPDDDADRAPDRCIARFLDLIETLPPAARAVWDRATVRELDIGVQSGPGAHAVAWTLPAPLLARAAAAGAAIALTVYGNHDDDADRPALASPAGS
ncbi:MAG: hypothetical protein R3F65_08405 [bacterium]